MELPLQDISIASNAFAMHGDVSLASEYKKHITSSTLVTGKRNLPNGAKKRYIRFDAFVRTMIMQELKANQRK